MSNTAFFQDSNEFNDAIITVTDQTDFLPNSVNTVNLPFDNYAAGDFVLAVKNGQPVLTDQLSAGATSGWQLEASDVISGSVTTYERTFQDSNADAYLVQFVRVVPASSTNSFRLRTSSDGGLTFDSGSSDYAWGLILQDADAGATNIALSSTTDEFRIHPNAFQQFYFGYVLFQKPFSSTLNPVIYSNCYLQNKSMSESLGRRVALSGTIDAVQFQFLSQNITQGTFNTYKLLK